MSNICWKCERPLTAPGAECEYCLSLSDVDSIQPDEQWKVLDGLKSDSPELDSLGGGTIQPEDVDGPAAEEFPLPDLDDVGLVPLADESRAPVDDMSPQSQTSIPIDDDPSAPPAARPTGIPYEPVPIEGTASYLIEVRPDGQLTPYKLDRPYHSVGRKRSGRKGAKIPIDDRSVSRWHLSVTQLGKEWVINRHSRASNPVLVNGQPVLQRTLRHGDLVHIGRSNLVFIDALQPTDRRPLRPFDGTFLATDGLDDLAGGTIDTTIDPEWAGADEPTLQLLDGDHTAAVLNEGVLLLGASADMCRRATQPGIAPLHAHLCWLKGEAIVTALGGNVFVNKRPVKRSKLADGNILALDGTPFTVRIFGDASSPPPLTAPPQIGVTVFHGIHTGNTVRLPIGRPVALGRSGDVELSVPRERLIDELQVELMAGVQANRAAVSVRNLSERVGVLINGGPIDATGRAVPGDVIQFGTNPLEVPTALLVHLDLARDVWRDSRS